MSDDEIIQELRGARGRCSPAEIAELLDKLTNGDLSRATLISYFIRAFPDISLATWREAGHWRKFPHGTRSDEWLNALFSPWL